jgi:hypothetical protein
VLSNKRKVELKCAELEEAKLPLKSQDQIRSQTAMKTSSGMKNGF